MEFDTREKKPSRPYAVFDPKTAEYLGEVTARNDRHAQKLATTRWNCSMFAVHIIPAEQLSVDEPVASVLCPQDEFHTHR